MNDLLPYLFAQEGEKAETPKGEPRPAEARPAGDAAPAEPRAKVEQPPPGEKPAPGMGEYLQIFAPFILIAVVFYLIVLRPQRKEASTREEMLKQLKKNDRVLTIGGIIGTVANISADGKEVTLKIDDNAKMHVIRSAIQTVLTGEAKPPETK